MGTEVRRRPYSPLSSRLYWSTTRRAPSVVIASCPLLSRWSMLLRGTCSCWAVRAGFRSSPRFSGALSAHQARLSKLAVPNTGANLLPDWALRGCQGGYCCALRVDECCILIIASSIFKPGRPAVDAGRVDRPCSCIRNILRSNRNHDFADHVLRISLVHPARLSILSHTVRGRSKESTCHSSHGRWGQLGCASPAALLLLHQQELPVLCVDHQCCGCLVGLTGKFCAQTTRSAGHDDTSAAQLHWCRTACFFCTLKSRPELPLILHAMD